MKIDEALEKEITRGNCKTCPKRVRVAGFCFSREICEVTEERIGSGNEYCELVGTE